MQSITDCKFTFLITISVTMIKIIKVMVIKMLAKLYKTFKIKTNINSKIKIILTKNKISRQE